MSKKGTSAARANNSSASAKKASLQINGESFHKLVIDVNKKWKENIGIFALERFLKKESKRKTSELRKIFDHFGVDGQKLSIDIIKAVFKPNRLKTPKGKAKMTFSAFSWLKDLESFVAEGGDLKALFDGKVKARPAAKPEKKADKPAAKAPKADKPAAKPEKKAA